MRVMLQNGDQDLRTTSWLSKALMRKFRVDPPGERAKGEAPQSEWGSFDTVEQLKIAVQKLKRVSCLGAVSMLIQDSDGDFISTDSTTASLPASIPVIEIWTQLGSIDSRLYARYRHVDALDDESRENLEKASVHNAILAVIKPVTGRDLALQFQSSVDITPKLILDH